MFVLDLNIGYRHAVMYLYCTYVCGVYSSTYAVHTLAWCLIRVHWIVYSEPCMYVQVVICCELILLFIAERTKCLSLVCHKRPYCHCQVPCPQNGGPPLWLWWWRSHSLAPCSLLWPVVHGEVPREILWIWSEGHWQGWPALFAPCLMFILCPL